MSAVDPRSLQALKKEWDSLQPLSEENEQRLWKKLRLEWDFHSNHIEGNTLTYGETELLLLFGETRGNHTIREYEEMKGHDVAISHVRELAGSQRPISETDVRNLNELLLKEPFWKSAITSTGDETRKQIIPGRYKIQPNNVRTATGETFKFVDPLDVPARMQSYISLLNSVLPFDDQFLPQLAIVHHEFLFIHPFDDGNGRVGRLLLNYVLMKAGFPPVVIRAEQKAKYLAALHQADLTEPDYTLLRDLFAEALSWSLEVGIKAAQGELIEEIYDVEKEIVVLAKSESPSAKAVGKTTEAIKRLWITGLHALFSKFGEKVSVLGPLFEGATIKNVLSFDPLDTPTSDWRVSLERAVLKPEAQSLMIRAEFYHYNRSCTQPFSYDITLSVSLAPYDYTLRTSERGMFMTKGYMEGISSQEIDQFVDAILRSAFDEVKRKATD